MCDCIQQINDQLKQHGAMLSGGITMSGKFLLSVGTERIDGNKRKNAPNVFCSFCPFCGQKFDTQESGGHD